MTLIRRLSGEITDIRSIEFVCKKCGTITSFNPATWNATVPTHCRHCPDAPKWTQTTDENIRQFAILLTQLVKAANDMPFEVRFDFDLRENG